jgi:hypothetical protein
MEDSLDSLIPEDSGGESKVNMVAPEAREV